MAEIAKIVQGNNFNVAIPLKVYILNEGEVVLQDYTPAEGDDVTIRLVGERRGYTYKPTIEGNVAHLQLSGHEVCDTYAVEVVIISPDGTMLRSYRGDQLAIVYNVDTIIADGAVEEGELYLDSQFFVQGQKGEQGDPGQDGTDGQDGADGRGIVSITKTATAGLVDTYTITYTDGTTSTFEVTNGKDGSGEDSLIVTLTYQSGTYIADKTYNEITAAIQAGRNVLVFSSVSQNYATLSRATSGKVEFSHIESVGSQMMGQFLVCNSNDTWATSSKSIQQGLVSGTSIKTINSTSLLGSGDIAVAEEFIVNVSYNGSAYSADKTPEQCCSAFTDGKRVLFQSMAPLPNDGGSQTYVATSVMALGSSGSYSVYAVGSVNNNGVSVLKYQKSTITGTTLSITNFDLRVVNNLTSTSTTSSLSAAQGKALNDGKQDKLVSGTSIKTINSQSVLGSGDIAVTTPTDLATYCPIIEDTRSSAVAAITGVAPFASLVDGQRIVLKMKYSTTGTNPMPTLELSLSNNTTTGQKALYFMRNNSLQRIGESNFQLQLINGANYVAYIEMTYSSSMDGWFCDYNYWHYTQYSTITQAQIDAGTATTSVVVTPQRLCDNFQKLTKHLTNFLPSGAVAPQGGYLPNILYDFGTTDAVNFGNLAAGANDVVNLYLCTWTCQTDGCSVTLPQSVVIAGGESLEIKAGRTFEVTIRDNKLSFLYFD